MLAIFPGRGDSSPRHLDRGNHVRPCLHRSRPRRFRWIRLVRLRLRPVVKARPMDFEFKLAGLMTMAGTAYLLLVLVRHAQP